MSNEKNNQIELHSEKVRNIIGEVPLALVRWGIMVIILMFILLIVVFIFFPYPYGNGDTIIEHMLRKII